MIQVSVIVPVYNRCEFIASAVSCLKNQTLPEIEFILIDDGSSDNTYAQMQQATAGDKRFHVLSLPHNQGPSAARNLGLAHVHGRYIGFFDCDDEIPPDYFESLWRTADQTGADVVYTTYNDVPHLTDKTQLTTVAERLAALRNGALWNKLYAWSAVKQIRFDEGLYCADNIYLYRVIHATDKMVLVNKPAYQYTLRPDSIGRDPAKVRNRRADMLTVARTMMRLCRTWHYRGDDRRETKLFLWRTFDADKITDLTWRKRFERLVPITRHRGILPRHLLKVLRFCHLISKERYKADQILGQMVSSGLFDPVWYRAHYTEVVGPTRALVAHYLTQGWRQGYNPGPHFDGNAYRAQNPDVAAADVCPLWHYVNHGVWEHRPVLGVDGLPRTPMPGHRPKNKVQIGTDRRSVWTYPLWLNEECARLADEIRALEREMNK